jgi:hypothetical protein
MSHAKLKALAFLVAIPLGFALAVWLGREAATYAKPDKFVRFHQGIAPESLFYPPFSTLENLALARWSPGRTLVIIGGNSILNGVGQSDKNLWSRRLQEELGERYVVVNLSFRGALPCEAGALVAESLIKRGLPVVLISNTAPATVGRVAGGAYGYLYYEALAHDRLIHHPAREADLAAWEETATPSIREQQAELRRAAALDARFHFQALWHHIGYRYGFITWTQVTRDHFWRPRDKVADDGTDARPLPERFHDQLEAELAITRAFSAGLAESTGPTSWRTYAPHARLTGDLIDAMFPPAVRARTIMLLNQNAPYYRSRLTPMERSRDDFVFATYEQLWRDRGVVCHTVGANFTDEDFADRTHLAPSGGRKLAHLVADYVRQLNPP